MRSRKPKSLLYKIDDRSPHGATYSVKRFLDLEGKVVGKDLMLDRDSILVESGFDSVMVEEEVDGYMGNEVSAH